MNRKKLNLNPNNKIKRRGFTLVEMVIVAPIVIIVIGTFILAIINMVGAVMASRGSNTLAYNIQQALSQIDQDVTASSGFLAVNNVTIRSPQGYNNDTTNFKNADATNGAMLILNTYTTTSNPISATRSYVYAIGQPYACNSTLVNQNTKITVNIIYFVKTVNGVSSLWRRTVAPSDYASAKCGVPWQQPSCSPIITDAFCTTKDQELVDGVQPGGFNVSYFVSGPTTANVLASDATQSDTMRQAAMDPTNTVNVQITAGATMAGRNISQTGSIRSINSNTTYGKLFGNTRAETGDKYGWDDQKIAGKFTLTESGSISKLTGHVSNNDTGHQACHGKAILYSDNTGTPNALLATGSEVAIADNAAVAWVDFAFASNVNLTAGNYWLGIIWDSTATGVDLKSAATGGNGNRNSDNYSDGASNPWLTSSPATWQFAIYATYTTGPT